MLTKCYCIQQQDEYFWRSLLTSTSTISPSILLILCKFQLVLTCFSHYLLFIARCSILLIWLIFKLNIQDVDVWEYVNEFKYQGNSQFMLHLLFPKYCLGATKKAFSLTCHCVVLNLVNFRPTCFSCQLIDKQMEKQIFVLLTKNAF